MGKGLNIIDWAVIGGSFVLMLTLWLMGLAVWSFRRGHRQRQVLKRLGASAQPASPRTLRLWHDGQETLATLPEDRTPMSRRQRLTRYLQSTGWQASPQTLIAGLLAVDAAALLAAWTVTGRLVLALLLPAALTVLAVSLTKAAVNRQLKLFERQLVDALELAARSLRAGHPLVGAFRLISQEIGSPIGPIFADICQRQELGLSLQQALTEIGNTTAHHDLRLFSTSVCIQLRSGGNLADMMDRLAAVIRDRMRLARRIRVLTAQTQFSKKILLGLPVLLFIGLNILNPRYMAPLYTTDTGRVLLMAAGTVMLLGAWMMNRLAVLKY